MRFLCLIILISLVVSAGFASDGNDLILSVGIDTSSVRSLITPSLYLGGSIEASLGDIGISLPVTFIADGSGGEEQLLDVGLHLIIHPFPFGLFYSISLIETVFFLGPYLPETRVHTMNEMTLGYEIPLPGKFSLVPRLRLRNISGTFDEEFAYIQGFIPGYTQVDAAVEIRFAAASFAIDSKEKKEE